MGEATAKALAPQGAAVAVVARRKDRLERLAEEIQQDVATELQSHLRDEISEQAAARFDDVQILQSEDIADAVVYIVTRPRHMAINEILIRPTEQEG
jgi:NADP-dependent 3-hydroxy acid dehydrogenase YdfG